MEITVDDWCTRLKRTSRPIKVALLDQKLVAGIGNLYASEILHLAGIHPARPADGLGNRRIERLAAAVRTVLETAIRHEGSTLSDGTYRNALNQAGEYQNAHRVYDREHESCPTCHGPPIVRIVQAQRFDSVLLPRGVSGNLSTHGDQLIGRCSPLAFGGCIR